MKKYIFKEKFFKITDKYWIKDEKGEDVFYLDQDFTFMGYKAAVFSPDKKRLFTINKKIISLLPKFFVDFEDGSKMVINKRFTLLRKFIDVDTDFGRINLKGSIWDYNFLISLDGKKIGEVNRKFITLTDHYVLSVFDENRSEEHTSELQSVSISYAVFCLKK